MNTAKSKENKIFSTQALLDWFKENQKLHFFRFDRNPYKVWVTEVILQQTRINYALPKLERFLSKFPNLRLLAEAKESEVLAAFQGLGYYNRAINLHAGARYIHEKLRGDFPKTYDGLLTIPSIGTYTASAIASICFQEKKPAIDGNLRRIYSRLCLIQEEVKSSKFQKGCENYFGQIFRDMREDPGLLNEALMELGQTKCTTHSPKCSFCPLNESCGSSSIKNIEDYPKKTKSPKKKEVIWLLFLVAQNRQLLLQKDKTGYFLKNQWSLPSILYFPDEQKRLSSYYTSLPEKLKNRLESVADSFLHKKTYTNLTPIRHTITHHRIHIYTKIIKINRFTSKNLHLKSANTLWCPIEALEKTLPSMAIQKALSGQI